MRESIGKLPGILDACHCHCMCVQIEDSTITSIYNNRSEVGRVGFSVQTTNQGQYPVVVHMGIIVTFHINYYYIQAVVIYFYISAWMSYNHKANREIVRTAWSTPTESGRGTQCKKQCC